MKRTLHCLIIIATGYLSLTGSICAQSIAGLFPTIDASWQLNEKQSISTYQFYAIPIRSLDSENAVLPNWLLYYGEYSANRNLGKKLALSGAYVYQLENIGNSDVATENRAHVQLKYSATIGKASITGRVRSDNRFIKTPELATSIYTHRTRFLAGINVPLNAWTINAYTEFFYNNRSFLNWKLAENWSAIQFRRQIQKNTYVEFGPLFIGWQTASQQWLKQYYLQTTILFAF